jgi:hypothetical protein
LVWYFLKSELVDYFQYRKKTHYFSLRVGYTREKEKSISNTILELEEKAN